MTRPEPGEEGLSAREAAALLGVDVRSLYAYVSRGRLRSLPGPGRARRYAREEVERLLATRGARGDLARHEERLAQGTLRWGAPVLESSVTQVTPEGPRYRGQPALALARGGVSFEAAAELLWTGTLPAEPPVWRAPLAEGLGVAPRALPSGADPLALLAALVPALGARDPGRFDRTPGAVLPRARRLLRRMAAALAHSGPARGERAARRQERALRAKSVAGALAGALGARGGARAVRALDVALVLWADHELNVSAFATRVVASADADLYACLSAGLGALAGPKHGGALDRIEALVAAAGEPEGARRALHDWTRRGEALPGFGHPLYPGGDPRATPLLEAARALAPRSRRVATAFALIEAVERHNGLRPAVDTGLVALAAALGLEPGAAAGVAALGRCAGLVAHTLEQYAAGFLIRPRARYRASLGG